MDAADRLVQRRRRSRSIYPLDGRVERRTVEHSPVPFEHEADHVRQSGLAHRNGRPESLLDRGKGRRVQEIHTRPGQRPGLETVVLACLRRGQGLLGEICVPLGPITPATYTGP